MGVDKPVEEGWESSAVPGNAVPEQVRRAVLRQLNQMANEGIQHTLIPGFSFDFRILAEDEKTGEVKVQVRNMGSAATETVKVSREAIKGEENKLQKEFTLTYRGRSYNVALCRVAGVQHVEYDILRNTFPSGIIYQDKDGNWINKTTVKNLGSDLQKAAQAAFTENMDRVYSQNE